MNQQSEICNPQSALEKMNIQMIISGVGGQGVLLVTRIFSDFALREGYPLIGSEDHGMSQRGGSVITEILIAPLSKGAALTSSYPLKGMRLLKPSTISDHLQMAKMEVSVLSTPPIPTI
jgi:indolepyruvate ferredoxin oxidoreductase beta subunit